MLDKVKSLRPSPERRGKIIVKLSILFLAAIFLTWLLEYKYFLNSLIDAWGFFSGRGLVFWYSVIIMFFIELIIYGVVRRPFSTVSVTASFVLIIGYLHIEKFKLRGVPLFPEDFQLGSQVGTMAQFVNFTSILGLILTVVVVLALGVLADKRTDKWLFRERLPNATWWKKYALVSRIAIIAVAILGFLTLTDFARNHNGTRTQELPWLNSHFTAWNQIWNYNDNGFILGFMYNCNKSILRVPDGYSEEKVHEIKASVPDENKNDPGSSDYNIVLILNESFYDPSIIAKYYPYEGGDVTPNLHAIQKKYPSGQMYSIDYGGGTANIEFEVLTSLTNYWMQTVPYTNLLPKKKQVPSIASYLREYGFETAVIHPFAGGMYKRNSVLPILGFENFLDEKEFKFTEREGSSEYINDKSSYLELIDYLKNHDKKQLVSLITMQNHAPYEANEYSENKFKSTANISDDEKTMVETYYTTLNISDKYLGELIGELNKLDEKTIVLFFGDHSPGIFNTVLNHEEHEVQELIRLTPYFIYSNFEIAKEKLPTTTPNCLLNTLFGILNLKKSKVMQLADKVCTEQPILAETYFGESAPFMSTDLSAYQMITYDLVGGAQYFRK